jgi:hypothetical protein
MSKKEYNAAPLPRKLAEVVELLTIQLVLQHVGITVNEIRKKLHSMSGVDISESIICQFLHDFPRQNQAHTCSFSGMKFCGKHVQGRHVHL